MSLFALLPMKGIIMKLNLTEADIARYDALVQTSRNLQLVIKDGAAIWRGELRRLHPDLAPRRKAFLKLSIISEPAPPLARYLCCRAEKLAAELDAREEK